MSRIYDNSVLQNTAVHQENVSFSWNPSLFQSGRGVIVQGECVLTSRHVISDADNRKERYSVVYVRPSRAQRRRFDDVSGRETEPEAGGSRKVSTGHLMSSFRLEAKDPADCLTETQLAHVVNKKQLVAMTDRHCPPRCVAFWISEAETDGTEMETGREIRLKTHGDGPFICSFAKLDGGSVTKCNFAGDGKVGASWTEKILASKSEEEETAVRSGGGDGAGEDEWGD